MVEHYTGTEKDVKFAGKLAGGSIRIVKRAPDNDKTIRYEHSGQICRLALTDTRAVTPVRLSTTRNSMPAATGQMRPPSNRSVTNRRPRA